MQIQALQKKIFQHKLISKLFNDKKLIYEEMLKFNVQEKRFETFFNNYAQIESLL